MSRNPKAELGPAHGLAFIVWCALDSDTWEEFGRRIAWSLQVAAGGDRPPRALRKLIRSFWPSEE